MTIRAFVPANLSCFFSICPGKTPLTTGSKGCGFTLSEGARVEVKKSNKTQIFYNGKQLILPPVEKVVNTLLTNSVSVTISSPFPLGCGFGMSGASALGAAYAINELFQLHKDKLSLAKIAYKAEVESGTGLADVENQYFGGFLLKTVPSYKFKVNRLPIEKIPVYCKVFDSLKTPSVIENKTILKKINKAGEKAILSVAGMTFSQILSVSHTFAKESGLLKSEKVINTIDAIEKKGGHASMILLGNAVMSDIPFEGAAKFTISSIPAHIL